MEPGKDFVYVTKLNDKYMMWLDEPHKCDDGVFRGKYPFVNSQLYDIVCKLFSKHPMTDDVEIVTSVVDDSIVEE